MEELDKAANDELQHSYANSYIDHFEYGCEAMLYMFRKGAEWQSGKSPWISVENQLPQSDDDLYIVLDTKMNPPGCGVCNFNPKTKAWIDERYNIVNPTHWMPIPKFNEE